MKILGSKLFSAIRGGDLKSLKEILEPSTTTEVDTLLTGRLEETIRIRRPSTGHDLHIQNPTPLILAVATWYTEIVEYLAGFSVAIDADCVVDDPATSPRVYAGVTALHVAALAGKLGMVQCLVQNGSDLNQQTNMGDTALYEACAEGHLAVVQYLIQQGAGADIVNNNQTTCLMIATYADNADIIKFLLSCGTDVNKRDKDGRNALFYTTAGGRLDTFMFLLENGAVVRADNEGRTILMEAAYRGQIDIAKYIIQYSRKLDVAVLETDNAGRNALFYLCEGNNTDLLEFLVRHGVTAGASDGGRTLIMVATLKNNKALVQYLLENSQMLGLDVNEKDEKGRNCLFYCITASDLQMFEMLLAHGVKVTASTDGITILMQAVAKHKVDFTNHILDNKDKYNIDINSRDKDGWNCLFYAVAGGHMDLFELLVSRGAQAHPAADGRTMLMQAVAKGDTTFVQYLLEHATEHQVYINQKDNDGWNALFYTIQGGHIDVFRFLLKRGARVCTALNGASLLIEAVDKGQANMVEFLLENTGLLGIDLNQKDQEGSNALFYSVAGGHLNLLKLLLERGCRVDNDVHGRNILMQAALCGQREVVQYLVVNSQQLGFSLHDKDHDNRNVIFYCVEGGHLDLMDFLIGCGIHLVPDKDGKTNLMQAARGGHVDIVEYMMEHAHTLGADINSRDKNGENALFYAIRAQRMAIVNMLLQNGIEISSNIHGVNVLSQSMSEGHTDVVKAILSSPVDLGMAVNGKDTRGRSVLYHCILNGNLEMLKQMGRYYDPSLDYDIEGITLLMRACRQPHLDFVKYLVEELHVDVSRFDSRHRNALFHAVEASNIPTVTYLLELYGEVYEDVEGKTPLMITSQTGNVKMAEILLNSKFSSDLVNKCDKNGSNSAHYCAIKGRDSILKLLDSYGCNLDSQDRKGVTPLMCACAASDALIMATLVKKGVSVEKTDQRGRSPLHYCLEATHPSLKCIKLLLYSGAKVNCQDKTGITPLMIACATCAHTQISVIRCLLDNEADPVLQDQDGKDAFDHCPWGSDYVKGMMRRATVMDDPQREALERVRPKLIEGLELNSVLRGLLKAGIFTRTLNFEVMKQTPPERVAKLLDLLCTRGNRAFKVFCNVLKREFEVELAYELQRASYVKEVEFYV